MRSRTTPLKVSIKVNSNGVISSSSSDVQTRKTSWKTRCRRTRSCRAAVVLTSGYHENDIGEGQALAQAINRTADDFSAIFENTAFNDYANLNQPYGQVDMEICFYSGCVPS